MALPKGTTARDPVVAAPPREKKESLSPQPVPALQKIGFHGTMRDFNERVRSVVDAHERSQGYRPTPALVLVAAKSKVPTPDLPKLFEIPRTKAAARASSFFKTTNGVIETTDPLAGAAGVAKSSSLVPDELRLAADQFQSMSREQKREFFQRIGELSPSQRMRLLRRAGYLSSGSQPVGREDVQVAGPGQDVTAGAAAGARYGFTAFTAVAGGLAIGPPILALEEGKAVKASVEQRSLKPFAKAQVDLAKGAVSEFKHVASDPLAAENVGFAALFIFGGLTGGAGAVARGAAAKRQLKDGKGVKAAVAAPTSEGGSLLHRPPPGRTRVRYGDTEYELLNSGNPFWRPIQLAVRRRREKKAQDGFNEARSIPADAAVLLGKDTFRGRTFAWEKKLGREADKRVRLERQLRMMTVRDIERTAGWTDRWTSVREKLPDKALGGLSRGEQMALLARTLDDPNPVATMRAFHEEKILEGPKAWRPDVDEATWNSFHQQKLRDLDAAERALANPSKRFEESLGLVDRAVGEMEAIKIQEAGLLVSTAEARVAKPGEVFRTGKPVDPDAPPPQRVTDTSKYVPFVSASKRKKLPKHTLRGSRLNIFAAIGKKRLQVQFPEVYHQFTGKAIIAGDYRIDTTNLVAESLGNAVQGAFRMSQYKSLLDQATPARKSVYDRPILKPDADGWPDEVKAFLLRADEGQVTKQDAITLSRQDWQDMQRHIYPGQMKNGQWVAPSNLGDDVLWVDERLLSAAATKPPIDSRFIRGLEAAQSAVRVPALYFAPRYIFNLLSNQVTALITTGPLAPRNTARAYFHKSWLDDSTWQFFTESVGVGRFGSYVDEAFSGRQSRRIAHFWNRLTDQHARVGAALHHAEQLGYKTGDDLKALVDEARADRSSKAFEDLLEIKERANKDMVQLDNLTWAESAILRHAIYVYPWRRGQAVWALRTLVEHPVKASVLAAIGKDEGEEIQDLFLERVPEWFERNGYIPTLFNDDGSPRVTAPATLHTWGDLQTIIDPDLPRMFGPAGQFVVERLRIDQYGNELADAHEIVKWAEAFKKVFAGLPQVRAATGGDDDNPLPDFDVTDRDTLIRRMNAADSTPVLAPGFWDGWGSLFTGAFTPRDVNELALQADWYKELPQSERFRFNVAMRDTVLGLQAQAIGRPVPPRVRDALDVFNAREKHMATLETRLERDLTPLEQTNAHIDFYLGRKALEPEQAEMLRKEAKRQEDADAHTEFRQDLFDAYGDPHDALKDWDSDVRMVAALSKSKVVNQRLRELSADGLLKNETRSVGLPVKSLREYGRKVLSWYEKNREWRDRLEAATDPAEEQVMWQEYREWLDANDKPVTVDGKVLPSPARIEWARKDAEDRKAIVADRAGRSWSQLSTFDKELLGKKVDRAVAKGWVKLEETLADQRAAMPAGEKFPSGHELAIAKWVDRHHAPGFYKDWLFSREPLVRRMQQFSLVKKSRFQDEWRAVLGAAQQQARYLTADYNKGEVKDLWERYVRSTLQPWVDSRPGFQREVASVHPQLLYRLLD